jgi:hypothetical protein
MPRRMISAVLLALALGGASCARSTDRATFYVLSPRTAALSSFPATLATLERQSGLRAEVGHATDDQGRTFFAVEAKSIRLRVWAQNMPLDPAPVCNHTERLEVDPRYFVVEVEPTLSLFGRREARDEAAVLQRGLAKAGFGVQTTATRCGSTDL